MRKTEIKNNKGITLIALIVTIVVLLILATVSIKLLVDNGIVGRSKSATSKYVIAEEKEKINLAYADYKMEKAENGDATLIVEGATVSGEEYSGWTITFDKTGNRYRFVPSQGQPELKPKTEDEEFLEKYMLGEDKKGIDLYTIFDMLYGTFSDSNVIKLRDLAVSNNGEGYAYVYAKYKEKVYKLVSKDMSTGISVLPTYMTQSVELVYEPKGREGQTVKYSIDGTKENEKDWTVLYDYGNGVVEIISPDAMGSLTLGISNVAEDEEAQNPGDVDKNGQANTFLDKAIYSYNNAVSRINKYASSFVTNSNKISVRSVGSNPNNPSAESGMYTSERLSQWSDGKYNGIGKKGDLNAEQDLIRMSYYGVVSTESSYWLASRCVFDFPYYNNVMFEVRNVNSENDHYMYGTVWEFDTYHDACVSDVHNILSVRPVVKINSDSIK